MADIQVETILLAAPSTSSSQQQPADLLLSSTTSNSPSSSTSHPVSAIALSTTTAVDTTNQQMQSLLCKSESEASLELEEPETKRRKTSPAKQTVEKLEARLNGILCCAVCLDLPKNAIYQVGTTTTTLSSHLIAFQSEVFVSAWEGRLELLESKSAARSLGLWATQ